jgi:hypothetical protein
MIALWVRLRTTRSPHSAQDESRRLELLEQRLDPLTKRRIQRLGVGRGAIAAAARDQLDTGQRGVPDHYGFLGAGRCNLPSPSCHLLLPPIARAKLAAWVLAVSRAKQASTLARRLSPARAVRVAGQG